MKARIDGFIRFVSVYDTIVFMCLFNCVDLNMQPKIDMVFSPLFIRVSIHFYKKSNFAMGIEKQRLGFKLV